MSTITYMAATTTVRVRRETRDALARLGAIRGVSTADLLADLVERQEQDELLDQMNAAYSRRLGDPSAREREELERRGWETTLLDGLGEL